MKYREIYYGGSRSFSLRTDRWTDKYGEDNSPSLQLFCESA